eukprot:TRINITY_DN22995_c0_g1_i1.p1 TRINITY_DN22995_c0_g1~~TRINITY_DN22995_c0_g1_i1.p1  ORF type:complete len:821 (+),score=166.07 TRINITY_DN22995_c0_g1_i1:188-2650(+)
MTSRMEGVAAGTQQRCQGSEGGNQAEGDEERAKPRGVTRRQRKRAYARRRAAAEAAEAAESEAVSTARLEGEDVAEDDGDAKAEASPDALALAGDARAGETSLEQAAWLLEGGHAPPPLTPADLLAERKKNPLFDPIASRRFDGWKEDDHSTVASRFPMGRIPEDRAPATGEGDPTLSYVDRSTSQGDCQSAPGSARGSPRLPFRDFNPSESFFLMGLPEDGDDGNNPESSSRCDSKTSVRGGLLDRVAEEGDLRDDANAAPWSSPRARSSGVGAEEPHPCDIWEINTASWSSRLEQQPPPWGGHAAVPPGHPGHPGFRQSANRIGLNDLLFPKHDEPMVQKPAAGATQAEQGQGGAPPAADAGPGRPPPRQADAEGEKPNHLAACHLAALAMEDPAAPADNTSQRELQQRRLQLVSSRLRSQAEDAAQPTKPATTPITPADWLNEGLPVGDLTFAQSGHRMTRRQRKRAHARQRAADNASTVAAPRKPSPGRRGTACPASSPRQQLALAAGEAPELCPATATTDGVAGQWQNDLPGARFPMRGIPEDAYVDSGECKHVDAPRGPSSKQHSDAAAEDEPAYIDTASLQMRDDDIVSACSADYRDINAASWNSRCSRALLTVEDGDVQYLDFNGASWNSRSSRQHFQQRERGVDDHNGEMRDINAASWNSRTSPSVAGGAPGSGEDPHDLWEINTASWSSRVVLGDSWLRRSGAIRPGLNDLFPAASSNRVDDLFARVHAGPGPAELDNAGGTLLSPFQAGPTSGYVQGLHPHPHSFSGAAGSMMAMAASEMVVLERSSGGGAPPQDSLERRVVLPDGLHS